MSVLFLRSSFDVMPFAAVVTDSYYINLEGHMCFYGPRYGTEQVIKEWDFYYVYNTDDIGIAMDQYFHDINL